MANANAIGKAFLASLFLFVWRLDAQNTFALTSPDRQIQVSVEIPDPGSEQKPAWSARFHGKQILSGCRLGLTTIEEGDLTAGARLVRDGHREVDRRIAVLFGKAAEARDRFAERRLTLETPRHEPFEIVFRCYDDAVAFRYELPGRKGEQPISILDESTAFGLENNPMVYAQYLENFNTSHEHNVTAIRFDDLRQDALLDLPLTIAWDQNTYAAITEASLRHYAGMSLKKLTLPLIPGYQPQTRLFCQLTPSPDGTKVVGSKPLQSPWRVILLGTRAGALLESSTLYCLNDPPAFKDLSWIHPGKITFPWWNGDVYDGQRDLPILSFAMAKKYIDFCARTHIPTHSLTSDEKTVSPWYFQSKTGVAPGPDTDVTRPRADFDLDAIGRYAKSKGVRLWTWVHQQALRGRVEEAFRAFEKMGWSGMMVDFFDHDDQASVEHAEAILQAAARHHILIHFHGIWKATGWQRTYPNLMNHEGALNLEYLKWSDACSPEHNLMMAFTRLIAGPMDYHLGGFRSVPRSVFKPQNIAPNVLGTRCHHLAMYVCFDNPNPMVADYPTAYEGQPGFDFLQQVPTWWDETRVLAGEIGEILVTARRKGKTWYVGGMSARHTRSLALPLSFLGGEQYTARIWMDAPDAGINPNHLTRQTRALSRADALRVDIGVDGGFVAELKPAGARN